MKRHEAEADIRSVQRTCRGPHVLSVAVVVAALTSAIQADRATKAVSPQQSTVSDLTHVAPAQDEALGEDAPSLAYVAHDHDSAWFTGEYRAELEGCQTPGDVTGRLIADGHNRAAQFVDHVARGAGCGADVNAVICAGRLDGQPTSAPCPRCGRTISYTPGYYEIDEDDPNREDGDPTPACATS